METWLKDQKNRNLLEWDTFRVWLALACTGQKRCDKNTAQRFGTAIVRAMGQQKGSKRTISNSVDRFWNQICPIFPSQSPYIKNMFFGTFLSLSGGGRCGCYKKLCTRASLQNAVHGKSQPEIKLGHHASNLCFVGERNSEHDFFQLKWKLD